jgi:signal transduction histidine kinase
LLINAAQAIDSKGIVTIRTGMHSSMIWVDIADTGPGISEQDLAEIFDPFFTSKSPGKGAGLGLHLVRVVIEAHDGRTTVMSREGQGTTFRLILPVNNITESIA